MFERHIAFSIALFNPVFVLKNVICHSKDPATEMKSLSIV